MRLKLPGGRVLVADTGATAAAAAAAAAEARWFTATVKACSMGRCGSRRACRAAASMWMS